MRNILINPSGRSWKSGIYSLIPSLIEQHDITEVITLYKKFTVKKEYNVDKNMIVHQVNEFLINKSWKEAYTALDVLAEKLKNSTLICVGSNPNKSCTKADKLPDLYAKTLENDAYNTTYNFLFNMNRKLLLVYYLHYIKGIDVIQYIHDPVETTYGTDLRYFYNSDKYTNMKYYPFIEYEKFIFNKDNGPLEKEYLLTTGLVGIKKIKQGIRHELYYALEAKLKVFNNVILTTDNPVSKPEYDLLIRKSKFTFIFPSLDNVEWSYIRFIEAIVAGCVPLFTKHSNWKQAFKSHPEWLNICETYLEIEIESIEHTFNNYNKLTKLLIESNDYIKFIKQSYYK